MVNPTCTCVCVCLCVYIFTNFAKFVKGLVEQMVFVCESRLEKADQEGNSWNISRIKNNYGFTESSLMIDFRVE